MALTISMNIVHSGSNDDILQWQKLSLITWIVFIYTHFVVSLQKSSSLCSYILDNIVCKTCNVRRQLSLYYNVIREKSDCIRSDIPLTVYVGSFYKCCTYKNTKIYMYLSSKLCSIQNSWQIKLTKTPKIQ